MAKILFILIYWSAFFFLRHFFKSYDLAVPDRIFNIVGGALFVCLVLIYLVISAFLKAYLGVGKTVAGDRRSGGVSEKKAEPVPKGKTPAPVKEPEEEQPKKKSRVRILRANQDD